MLNEKDVDELMQNLQKNIKTYIFYVAHMIEPREGVQDEHIYKSSSDFKVIKLRLTNIQNAYFEYLNFITHPEEYHYEIEESYYDWQNSYTNHYVVPNAKSSYEKEFTSRMPSIIYGYRREIYNAATGRAICINDPSVVLPVYTNLLKYGDESPSEVLSDFNSGKLSWKYRAFKDVRVDKAYITTGTVNVYSQMSTNGTVRTTLSRGDDIMCSKINDNWVKIISVIDQTPTEVVPGKNRPDRLAAEGGYIQIKSGSTVYVEFMNQDVSNEMITSDDIDFKYVTSDWYILDIENFPRVEKPLINVNQYSAYFRDLQDAFNYIEQLKA